MSPLVNKRGALKCEFYIDDVSNDVWAGEDKQETGLKPEFKDASCVFQAGLILTCVNPLLLIFVLSC